MNELGTLFAEQVTLRPNPGPELLPPVLTWFGWLAYATAAAAVIVLLLLVRTWWLIPRRLKKALPVEWACAELARLQESSLESPEAIERFYVQVSGVLRNFLQRQFFLHAPEQTTQEFKTALANAQHLAAVYKEEIITLLEQADMVKFARQVPDQTGAAKFLTDTMQLVERSVATVI